MYQIETMTEAQARKTARRYIAIIGSTLAIATIASVSIAQSVAGDSQPQTEAFRILHNSEDGVWRLNETTGEVTVCTAENDGTLSCAVSHGLPPVENLPSTT
ncbi:MAG: hypothetical protein AAF563_12840 [Pseudomonadota bacterium]